jgi:hypothetical protein
MAFRYGIRIRGDQQNNRNLLAHECAHTGQYERLGGIPQFLTSYLRECTTPPFYPNGVLEQEAIKKAAAIAPPS